MLQSRSGRTARPEVTAELAHGQLGEDGVLCVEFASGETNRVKKPGDKDTRHDGPPTIILVNLPSGGIAA